MRLFQVNLSSGRTCYVLAGGYDAAVQAVVAEYAGMVQAYAPGTPNSVYDLGEPLQWAPTIVPASEPAVPIEESVTDDYIICLDDGKQFKSLKRHLKQLGMTPAEYRTKWGLPADFPMVAKSYSETRSTLAKAIGLGRK